MYAVIADSGTQFFVEEGQKVLVDFRDLAPETEITFDQVLVVGGAGEPTIGKPLVSNAKVTASVVGQVRMQKLHIGFYRKRKNYRRHKGHRQTMTEVVINKIHA
jgi:large subunit ribosomal protein L21